MDNCTLFPDGTWSECCARHDRRYENKRLTQWQADNLLYRCAKRKGNVLVGSIMRIGVFILGWYYYRKANNDNLNLGQ